MNAIECGLVSATSGADLFCAFIVGTKALTTFRSDGNSRLVFDTDCFSAADGVVFEDDCDLCLAAMLEYYTAEVVELAGNAARSSEKDFISAAEVETAIAEDEELKEMRTLGEAASSNLPTSACAATAATTTAATAATASPPDYEELRLSFIGPAPFPSAPACASASAPVGKGVGDGAGQAASASGGHWFHGLIHGLRVWSGSRRLPPPTVAVGNSGAACGAAGGAAAGTTTAADAAATQGGSLQDEWKRWEDPQQERYASHIATVACWRFDSSASPPSHSAPADRPSIARTHAVHCAAGATPRVVEVWPPGLTSRLAGVAVSAAAAAPATGGGAFTCRVVPQYPSDLTALRAVQGGVFKPLVEYFERTYGGVGFKNDVS